MDTIKRQRLEAAGWRVGTAKDFLGLSPAEVKLVELKLTLSKNLKTVRENQKLSQKALATRMKSSQSRVAKIEAGDPSVSLDLIFRALFSSGATREEIAKAIVSSEENHKNSQKLTTT
ncbi:MAG: helix-turn-helix transcriptional regulator [Symploca sp. SIO1C4]|uniref:Helix-turn-helix transcriptional regulator n=1 Tax=Symploca sp. SIO1C4 TaxID=2607765 RepID=A0A6B3NBI9_9CYAN|nr:helix-turn-helix transcriptional regulator [Symploca sp. SIO1C4]